MIQSMEIFDNPNTTPPRFLYGDPVSLVADANGVKWGLFDVEGWNDGADVVPAIYKKPFQDGAFLDAFTLAPRVMEIHGGLTATTRDAALEARRFLLRAFQVKDSAYGDAIKRLYVQEYAALPVGGVFIDVKRSGRPTFKPYNDGLAYEFSVPVVAADPRKYAFTQQHVTQANVTVTPLTLTNAGTIHSLPIMILTGPITNPVITHDRSGWFMKFNGALGAGQSVGFTVKDHSAGGTLGRNNVDVTSKWFPVLPGVNNYSVTGTGSSAATQLEAFFNDAYE